MFIDTSKKAITFTFMILTVEIISLTILIIGIFIFSFKHMEKFKNASRYIYRIGTILLISLMFGNGYLIFYDLNENFHESVLDSIHRNYKLIIYVSCIITSTKLANIIMNFRN